jgi:hypothetical protein
VRGTASAQVINTTKIKKIMAEKKTVSVKVVAKFRDKEDLSVVHEAGEVLEFEQDRAHDVVERGLAEYADPIG